MIDSQIPIAAEHQRIIASEFIGIDNRASSDRFNRHLQQTLGRDIPDPFHLDDPISFQNPKNRRLPGGSTAPFALAFVSEIGFIQFDLARHEQIRIQPGQNRKLQDSDRLEHGRITQPDLLGNSSAGELHFKKFDDPHPFLKWNSKSINPSTGEIMERITISPAAVALPDNSIDPSIPTSCTKNTAIFPTRFYKEQSGSILRSPDELKAL